MHKHQVIVGHLTHKTCRFKKCLRTEKTLIKGKYQKHWVNIILDFQMLILVCIQCTTMVILCGELAVIKFKDQMT